MYTIRPVRPEDYPACAAIATLVRPEPTSPAEVMDDDRRVREIPGAQLTRLVAEADGGTVIGYSFAETFPYLAPGTWNLFVAVHPGYRGGGVGRALYAAAERIAREGGATSATAWCRSDYPESVAWAGRLGYAQDLLRTESVLDLTAWDGSRFAGALQRIQAGGLRLERHDDQTPEAIIHGFYDLETATLHDIPGIEQEERVPEWGEYLRQWLDYTLPRTTVVALDGDRVVGGTMLFLPTFPGKGAYTGFTAVLREYRGRSIALAVKLVSVDAALERGVPRMRTHNDFTNPAMLAVNRKLGYQLVPGPWRLKKWL
jgi:GNAT superfamily N-acetyltransferase